ncbi:Uncharacterized protein TCM_017575 [Theobroma cacao]|uniref:Putative plant transposon protein domain-containing protein n=1 Tax=Theobroma cacao TaxID=3641 RepID=A0A061EER2_THECC|nr:Uncharacterized protein TCM_017575 [Theobroma cacao]
MLLVKHLSDVTKDRVVLLYAIVTGKSIDIRHLNFNKIIMSAHSPHNKLWYPFLITALCYQARVVWSPNEKLLHPKIPLDGGIIHKFHMCEQATIRGSSFAAPQPQIKNMLKYGARVVHQ